MGETDLAIDQYLENLSHNQSEYYFDSEEIYEASLTYLKITDNKNQPLITFLNKDPWQLKVGFHVRYPVSNLVVSVGLMTSENILIRNISSQAFQAENGNYEAVFLENEIIYGAGTYQIILSLSVNNHIIQHIDDGIFINFEETQPQRSFLVTKNKSLILNEMNVRIYSV